MGSQYPRALSSLCWGRLGTPGMDSIFEQDGLGAVVWQ